tara:strand:+ start:762 stop:2378 length:1617 start_codon:yes stop_codon:yes gene_type:complete
MKLIIYTTNILLIAIFFFSCEASKNSKSEIESPAPDYYSLTVKELRDKIKGAWAAQTIGVTYGGPTEFKHNKRIIGDQESYIHHTGWNEETLPFWMKNRKGLYDDIYMDLTFVEVFEREGLDAPAISHLKAYSEANFPLWHANQQGRYNYLNGINPPESGHWLNNPHADDIDFQIEADFAGIMSPGMPNTALEICDTVGHIMNSGDGYYGGVFVAGMYSFAFIEKDIKKIIKKALDMIPTKSSFYKCINDVVNWYEEYPLDWKKNWELIEQKWGNDVGCPNGVFRDFNIDAKINAAYVVLGMLYGEGDFGKTLDISTRAGQDSDCNPATSMGILATTTGLSGIPEYWLQGLSAIEDINFSNTEMSLNDVYEISFKHGMELIKRNGGIIEGNSIKIKNEKTRIAPFEENFPGYKADKKVYINKELTFENGNIENNKLEYNFNGIGVVLKGYIKGVDPINNIRNLKDNNTMKDFYFEVEFSIDNKLVKTMKLPLNYTKRALELFFKYEIPKGDHVLRLKVLNPDDRASIYISEMITYSKT